MIKRITVVFLLFALVKLGNTQGLQFNQWQHAPALLNPALTGAYNGSFRIGVIGKEKWGSAAGAIGQGWNTAELFIDAPIIRGFRKSDWIGVGISYDLDASGGANSGFISGSQDLSDMGLVQKLNVAGIRLAYHIGFGKKYKGAFTIGGEFSNRGKSLEVADRLKFESQIIDGTMPDIMAMGDAGELSADVKTWTLGVGYKAQMNKKNDIAFGLSMGQFGTQNIALNTGNQDLPVRTIGYFSFKAKTGKKSSFEPQVVFLKEGATEKLYTQAIFGYMFKPQMNFKYGLGVNTFNNDLNIPIYLGVDYKSWRFGLAYDVDLGATQQTSTYGGLELAVNYIHVLAKKPKPDPIIICPRL